MRSLAVVLVAASLSACSTMDIVLEKAEGDVEPSASVTAHASTLVGVEELITRVNGALQQACSAVSKGPENGQTNDATPAARPSTTATVAETTATAKELTAVAKALGELRDTALGLFPKNSYTAAKVCS